MMAKKGGTTGSMQPYFVNAIQKADAWSSPTRQMKRKPLKGVRYMTAKSTTNEVDEGDGIVP